MKIVYEAPETELVEVRAEKHFLNGSVASVGVNSVQGWTSSEEDW